MSDSEIKSTVFPLRCSGVVVESGMKSLVITNPIVNAFSSWFLLQCSKRPNVLIQF